MESIVIDRRITKWKNLKQRLSLKSMAMGCCGANWNPRPRISTISVLDEDDDHDQTARPLRVTAENVGRRQHIPIVTSASGMNLAMALAAERNLRGNNNNNNNNNVGPNPRDEVKTLMRLIEETEGVDWTQEQQEQQQKKQIRNVDNNKQDVEGAGGGGGGGGGDWMCCVCMERKKGAAFIPCGHTFCRVCSREVWLNRGLCPVCNRSILDVLDIF